MSHATYRSNLEAQSLRPSGISTYEVRIFSSWQSSHRHRGATNQRELAWAEIGRGEAVPTLWLQKLDVKDMQAQGRSFSYEEVKEYSQQNRETRLSTSAGK